MSEFKLPAYRIPVSALDAIDECVDTISEVSQGTFEPQPHVPHLTLLRQSLFRGRVGINISTQYDALCEHIIANDTEYSLTVKGVENTTKNLSDAAILAIIMDDPSGEYSEEYASIRSKLPQRLRGQTGLNTPHLTLGRLASPFATPKLLEAAENVLPPKIEFGPLLFSPEVIKYHRRMTM
ncbi:MAG TPA: hypothetical protein PK096_02330 [Candidatus Saccharibacteria bacterium]|nr:hypothetical protein [Candidatus Saccharibacteria bacterium]HRK94181.1 hypothetical protein [Candidatus Saccharibacteria bacterium]